MKDRHVLAYEGRTTVDQRIIQPGALWWGDLPLPVVGNRVSYEVANQIVAIEREGDLILAELADEMPNGFVLALDLTDVDITMVGEQFSFRRGKIIGATLVPVGVSAWVERER